MKANAPLVDAVGTTAVRALNASGPVEFGELLASHRICAWKATSFHVSELAELRKRPESVFPASITPQFFRHSENQTIVSAAAVYGAIAEYGLPLDSFSDWGVIAANRYVGRPMVGKMLSHYAVEGPWGISMQLIPHHMPHAVASAISLALGCRGVCIAAGSGPGGELQAALAAVNLFRLSEAPALWVVVSGWTPELAIDRDGAAVSDSRCTALAFALERGSAGFEQSGLYLRRSAASSSSSSALSSSASSASVRASSKTTGLNAIELLRLAEHAERSVSLVLAGDGDLQVELDLHRPTSQPQTYLRVDGPE